MLVKNYLKEGLCFLMPCTILFLILLLPYSIYIMTQSILSVFCLVVGLIPRLGRSSTVQERNVKSTLFSILTARHLLFTPFIKQFFKTFSVPRSQKFCTLNFPSFSAPWTLRRKKNPYQIIQNGGGSFQVKLRMPTSPWVISLSPKILGFCCFVLNVSPPLTMGNGQPSTEKTAPKKYLIYS